MKKASVLLTIMALAASAFAVQIGQSAPNFKAKDINGKTVRLSSYAGKIVVIESYNSDCPYCNNQYKTGAMQELRQQNRELMQSLAELSSRGDELRELTAEAKDDAKMPRGKKLLYAYIVGQPNHP